MARNALLVSCLVAAMAFATPAEAERLPIKVYTTAEGLSGSAVTDIVPDSHGFLWFTTTNGLDRFDGSEFRAYTSRDGLPGGITINTILEASTGEYWVGTNGAGVCRLDLTHRRVAPAAAGDADESTGASEKLFDCRRVADHFQSNRVNVIYEDRHHTILLATDNGVFRLVRDSSSWSVQPVPLLGRASKVPIAATAILEDKAGQIWIGLYNGIVRLDADGDSSLYTVANHDVYAISAIVDDDGVLLFASTFGLIALRPAATEARDESRRHVLVADRTCVHTESNSLSWPSNPGTACVSDRHNGLPADHVQALFRTRGGRLWIATAGGLLYREGAQLTSLASAENLSAAGYYALAQQNDDALWIGTTGGAMKLSMNGLVSYTTRDGLGNQRVQRFIEDATGTLFVISGSWIINRFDGARFSAIHPTLPAGITPRFGSEYVFLDRDQRWWLITNRGLFRLRQSVIIERAAQQSPELVYDTTRGLPSNDVVRTFEDSGGNVWIATRSVQTSTNVSRWEKAGGRVHALDGFGPDAQFPVAFVEDQRGAIWVAFETGVLGRYREGQLRTFGAADGVPRDIRALHLDLKGRLWIASSTGLLLLEDVNADSFHPLTFTSDRGLQMSAIRCLTEDRWGRIYVGTSRGVDRLDPDTRQLRHLTTSDGLAGDFVTTAYRDRNGVLWFGTNDGASRLVPVRDAPSPRPRISLGEVRVGGVLAPVPETGASDLTGLTLVPGRNHLQIAFFGLGFGAGGMLRYRYRLEGSERDWTGPTDRRSVEYESLAAGRYRFLVEAVTVDGMSSERPASVSFAVLPPVYLRWWFLAMAGTGVFVILYAVHRQRTRRLLDLERVRTRIAADLHDDIGGSLSRIAIRSEVARQDLDIRPGAVERHLMEIGDTARTVVDELGDVVWSVDPRHDDLGSVERRLRAHAADVLADGGVRWTFQGANLDDLSLNPQIRREIFLLLKEAITNISRHARAHSASLQLHVASGELRVELRDDGAGFDRSSVADSSGGAGRGIANMHARAQAIGGQLAIDSTLGAGTTLVLTVPLRMLERRSTRLH